MRLLATIVALVFITQSCDNEDPKIPTSEYVVVNKVNNRATISTYNSSTKTYTEELYAASAQFEPPFGVAKNQNYVYLNTYAYPTKLSKIDLTTGDKVNEVNSWTDTSPYINTHNDNIIVSHAAFDPEDNFNYFPCVKIYDKNLNLVDSVVTGGHIAYMKAATVVKDRLFSSIANDFGDFITVMDLNTQTMIDSVQISSPCYQLLTLNETQLLVFQYNQYFILNTQSLDTSAPIAASIGTESMTYSPSDNMLYYLRPNAQPAVTLYTLFKLDVSTGTETQVSEFGEPIAGPIVYDQNRKVIVTGSGDYGTTGIKTFSTDGKVMETVTTDAPMSTVSIFIK